MNALVKAPIDAEFERMLDTVPKKFRGGRKPGDGAFKPLPEGATVEDALKQLLPREQNFVRLVIGGRLPVDAVRESGWTGKRPDARAYHLQNKNKRVMQALEIFRKQMQKEGAYGFQQAMRELDETIAFSKQTENATAMARAVELKMKLTGQLVDRHEVKQANFNLNIGGIDDPNRSAP